MIGTPSKELNITAACQDSSSIRFIFYDTTFSTYLQGVSIIPPKGKDIKLVLSSGFQDSLIAKINDKTVLDDYIDNCRFEDKRCSSPKSFTIKRKQVIYSDWKLKIKIFGLNFS